jgi:CheY-like chemotaxis protein
MDAIAQDAPLVRLLVADDDPAVRRLLASTARDAVGELAVLEAEDGSEAIQLGLELCPEIALLDINMPHLGGFEAAVTLRELKPEMRLALQTGEPLIHRDRAREHRLPLFDKLELDRTLSWLQTQVQSCVGKVSRSPRPGKRSFVCCACGYGALRAGAPDRCPMCQAEHAWVEAPWRPSSMVLIR